VARLRILSGVVLGGQLLLVLLVLVEVALVLLVVAQLRVHLILTLVVTAALVLGACLLRAALIELELGLALALALCARLVGLLLLRVQKFVLVRLQEVTQLLVVQFVHRKVLPIQFHLRSSLDDPRYDFTFAHRYSVRALCREALLMQLLLLIDLVLVVLQVGRQCRVPVNRIRVHHQHRV
jgi:hypothetical protein